MAQLFRIGWRLFRIILSFFHRSNRFVFQYTHTHIYKDLSSKDISKSRGRALAIPGFREGRRSAKREREPVRGAITGDEEPCTGRVTANGRFPGPCNRQINVRSSDLISGHRCPLPPLRFHYSTKVDDFDRSNDRCLRRDATN